MWLVYALSVIGAGTILYFVCIAAGTVANYMTNTHVAFREAKDTIQYSLAMLKAGRVDSAIAILEGNNEYVQ